MKEISLKKFDINMVNKNVFDESNNLLIYCVGKRESGKTSLVIDILDNLEGGVSVFIFTTLCDNVNYKKYKNVYVENESDEILKKILSNKKGDEKICIVVDNVMLISPKVVKEIQNHKNIICIITEQYIRDYYLDKVNYLFLSKG